MFYLLSYLVSNIMTGELFATLAEVKQEAQMSQRERAMLRVIECFTKSDNSKSLKVIRNGTD